jgi:hypothetical protein
MLFALVPLFPQTSIPVKQETILTFAHDLLQVFYPELLNKDHRLSLCIVAPGDFPWVEIGGGIFRRHVGERESLRSYCTTLRKTIMKQAI